LKTLFLSLLMITVWAAAPAMAAEKTPSAYVIDIALTGEDAAANTVIVREGAEIAAKLMTPLFAGDIVFLRDPASRVVLETGAGLHVTVGAENMRFTVTGEIDTGDGSWSILAAIAGIFAGEGEQAPENMIARGGTLKVPAAVHGANLVLPRDRLALWWEGGKAPFTVRWTYGDADRVLATGVTERKLTVPVVADGARALPERFTLVISDAEQQKVQIRFRVAAALPDGPGGSRLARAAYLTSLDDGAWSIEALQQLAAEPSGAAGQLAGHIAAGWRWKGAK
jgi:hypothetical protein